jgi:hypothetical protein
MQRATLGPFKIWYRSGTYMYSQPRTISRIKEAITAAESQCASYMFVGLTEMEYDKYKIDDGTFQWSIKTVQQALQPFILRCMTASHTFYGPFWQD